MRDNSRTHAHATRVALDGLPLFAGANGCTCTAGIVNDSGHLCGAEQGVARKRKVKPERIEKFDATISGTRSGKLVTPWLHLSRRAALFR
jgi:hypothetical protein